MLTFFCSFIFKKARFLEIELKILFIMIYKTQSILKSIIFNDKSTLYELKIKGFI